MFSALVASLELGARAAEARRAGDADPLKRPGAQPDSEPPIKRARAVVSELVMDLAPPEAVVPQPEVVVPQPEAVVPQPEAVVPPETGIFQYQIFLEDPDSPMQPAGVPVQPPEAVAGPSRPPRDQSIYVHEPSVPPAGMPGDTEFFRDICLDMFVLTSWLKVDTPESVKAVEAVVKDWSTRVKDAGADAAFEDELELELGDGKVSKKTKRNTQYAERVSEDAIIVMRAVDYTTKGKIHHSNFRNSFTARKVGPDFTDRGRSGPTPLKGPTCKYFINGRIQAAGWKSIASMEAFVNALSATLGIPGVDNTKHKLSLVNGSARIKNVPAGGIALGNLADELRARGLTVRWDPTTGNNGLNLKVPDVESLRSAMIFSNGYVKMFALNEQQLARMVGTLTEILSPIFGSA